ncbi:hypothetical protein OG698_23525 [Streptomyces sp. NBC_01003]|uniref:hypothetical protein n=1 Tax=Streptomyces sp. NBC_01003 TaxID=2903714 RepID=UPI0038677303|nr:hypothetical protein OG698_23525 [Streptomyces sp. NBC_01003]
MAAGMDWVLAWVLVTVAIWLVSRALGSPKSWFTSSVLGVLMIGTGLLTDLIRERRRRSGRASSSPS